MDANFYKESSLRDKNTTDSWFFGQDDIWYKQEYVPVNGYHKLQPIERNSRWSYPDRSKGLFTLSLEGMRKLAEDVGISAEEAFSVQVYPDNQNDNIVNIPRYSMTSFGCDQT
jgi:hypothetical protein